MKRKMTKKVKMKMKRSKERMVMVMVMRKRKLTRKKSMTRMMNLQKNRIGRIN